MTCHRGQSLERVAKLAVGKPAIERTEDLYRHAPPGEGELQATARLDEARRQVHQLLHHGADPPALGGVANRSTGPGQSRLPKPAQDVIGQGGTAKHQRIGGKLPRWQALDVEVGLELAVKLLRRSVVGVERNDLLWRKVSFR